MMLKRPHYFPHPRLRPRPLSFLRSFETPRLVTLHDIDCAIKQVTLAVRSKESFEKCQELWQQVEYLRHMYVQQKQQHVAISCKSKYASLDALDDLDLDSDVESYVFEQDTNTHHPTKDCT